MIAVQVRALIVFAVIVAFVVALAAAAVPAQASGGSAAMSVGAQINRRIVISLPQSSAAASGAQERTLSNIACRTSRQWVERDGERVLMITVVPIP